MFGIYSAAEDLIQAHENGRNDGSTLLVSPKPTFVFAACQ
jgi:hypothetical protein